MIAEVIGVLPRRPAGDPARFVDAWRMADAADAGPPALVGPQSARSTFDDSEFKDLAVSVRKWLALTRATNVSAATPIERTDLSAPHSTGPDPRWPDRPARQDGQDRHDREDVDVRERPALLIDAAHVTSDRLPRLLETVHAAYGTPVISRAYADWTTPGLASWFALLRQYGVHPIHNFDTPDHNRSLVALTLEALDMVERYAVTRVVLVGDLGAALPLVTRLKAAGVQVTVIGPASNPDDVRLGADDFLDIASLNAPSGVPARGRHQA